MPQGTITNPRKKMRVSRTKKELREYSLEVLDNFSRSYRDKPYPDPLHGILVFDLCSIMSTINDEIDNLGASLSKKEREAIFNYALANAEQKLRQMYKHLERVRISLR